MQAPNCDLYINDPFDMVEKNMDERLLSEEMRRLGERMQRRREERGLSLKEVENSISIRSKFLQAIEEGKINQAIASVYATGFLKQYAAFLEMDLEKIIRENPLAFKIPSEMHEFSYGIGTLEMRQGLDARIKWLPQLLWTLGGVFTLTLLYYCIKALGML